MAGGSDVLLNLMARNEQAIADLYGVFAEKYPEAGELWRQLAGDEKKHAEILQGLKRKVDAGSIAFDHRKITADKLLASLDNLEKMTAKFARKNIKFAKALAFAIECEKSMLENAFFEVFDTDSSDIQSNFALLKEHTRKHRARLQEVAETTG